MAIRTETEMSEIEYCWNSRNSCQSSFVLLRCSFEVRHLDRHGVNLLARNGSVLQQTLMQVGEVAVRISSRSHALIDLEYMNACPGYVFIRQSAEHDPWSMSSADCHDESPTRRNRPPGILCDDRSSSSGGRLGIGEHFECHLRISNSNLIDNRRLLRRLSFRRDGRNALASIRLLFRLLQVSTELVAHRGQEFVGVSRLRLAN